MKIAFYNSKGGNSKTTSCANLGHALTISGKKVLLCDLDPQASLSFHLGVSRNELKPSIADVLLKKNIPIEKAIRKTSIPGLDLIPADLDLCSFDILFASTKGRELMLRDALNSIKGYDYILIDSAPTMGLTALNALMASNYLIVPTIPHHLNLQGLKTLEESLSSIRKGIGKCADILAILPTQLDRRSKAALEMLGLLRKHYGDLVFKTEIPINAKLSEAPSHGKTIFQYDSNASGAIAYLSVAKELLTKLKPRGK